MCDEVDEPITKAVGIHHHMAEEHGRPTDGDDVIDGEHKERRRWEPTDHEAPHGNKNSP